MITIYGIKIIKDKTDNNRIVFTLSGNKPYYMSSKERRFLIIDSDYFDKQWKKSSFEIQRALANIKNKKDDYKYNKAKEGFSFGIKNPVPIVEISIEIDNNDIIPTLSDGLTRTNYLLANNVNKLIFSVATTVKIENNKYYNVIDINNIIF